MIRWDDHNQRDDVTDSNCQHCHRTVILFAHEITVVTLADGHHRYRYECVNCGHENDQWLGTSTRHWMLSRGANLIVVAPAMELIDVARGLGPWTEDDVAQAAALEWVHSDLIWEELDAHLYGTDSGIIDWDDE